MFCWSVQHRWMRRLLIVRIFVSGSHHFIEMHVPSQEVEGIYMYFGVPIFPLCFHCFPIRFWNCSDSLVISFFLISLFSFMKINWNIPRLSIYTYKHIKQLTTFRMGTFYYCGYWQNNLALLHTFDVINLIGSQWKFKSL